MTGEVKTDQTKNQTPPQRGELDLLLSEAKDAPSAVREGRFFSALRKRMYVLVAQELGRNKWNLPASDVDDVVQELVLEIWRVDLERFDPTRASLLTFLRRKVRWRVIEKIRARGRRSRPLRLSAEMEEQIEDESTSVVQRQEEWIRHETAVDACASLADLEGLDERTRVVIVRHDLEGAALKDIAADMCVNPSTVTRMRQKGLRELRAHMTGGYRRSSCGTPSPSSSSSSPSSSRRASRARRTAKRDRR